MFCLKKLINILKYKYIAAYKSLYMYMILSFYRSLICIYMEGFVHKGILFYSSYEINLYNLFTPRNIAEILQTFALNTNE